jgi:GNAT superfamily N-acetyltransferase
MSGLHIQQIRELTPELVRAVGSLVAQLSATDRAPTSSELADILASPATVLFGASWDDQIIGMATLVLVRIPTAQRATIEDVIVVDSYRGHGIGRALIQAALERAKIAGARKVDLSCHPRRFAANRFYQHLGFTLRTTRPYQYSFDRSI